MVMEDLTQTIEEQIQAQIDCFPVDDAAQDLEWLVDDFLKGYVSDIEAAYCLLGRSYAEAINNGSTGDCFGNNGNLKVNRMYKIVNTSPKLYAQASLLWYLDYVIKIGVLNVRCDLLLPICVENVYLLGQCIEKYPNIIKELKKRSLIPPVETSTEENEVLDENSASESESQRVEQGGENSLPSGVPESDLPWVNPARIIFYELRPDNKLKTLDAMSHLIRKEMLKKVKNGDKDCCDRTGKAPKAGNILRFAIQKLPE